MQKFRRKAQIVEAVKFKERTEIKTERSSTTVAAGNWLFREASGSLHSCPPSYFEENFEPIEDEGPTRPEPPKGHIIPEGETYP